MNVDALATRWFDAVRDAIGRAQHPFVLGVSGLQGSGKSTVASALRDIAIERDVDAVELSLDDFYLTHAQRHALARDVHPLLATRGVPGTHDVALLQATLDTLAVASDAHPARVPRFDKGSDDRAPRAAWTRVTRPPQLVILEGWCIGVPAQATADLIAPVNALEHDEDPDGTWRRFANESLARDYAPLWSRLDALFVLLAPSFDVVHRWRDQQEQPARDRGATHALTTADVARFVAHYERLSRHALATLPALADLVVCLDERRQTLT